MKHSSDRDYLERTIATVRNHRDADNCWPSWANIFADEIEECWAGIAAARALLDEALWDEVAWPVEDLVERMERVYEALGGTLDGPPSKPRGTTRDGVAVPSEKLPVPVPGGSSSLSSSDQGGDT